MRVKNNNVIITNMEYPEDRWDGFLLVDKQSGISSYDVIRRLKPLVPRGTKIGHAGTLDPFASGLLVLLIGKYTKRSSEFLEKKKVYRFELELGYSTDTLDPTGNLVDKRPVPKIDKEIISNCIKKFIGEQFQTPPQFSAKKISGKPAYKYAREGKEVELKPKKITVYKINLIKLTERSVVFEAEVSSGTYIRSLGSDIAESLGTIGTVTSLERVSIGDFSVDKAIKSNEMDNLTISDLIK